MNGLPSADSSSIAIATTPPAASGTSSRPGTGTKPPGPSVLTDTVVSTASTLRTTITFSIGSSVPTEEDHRVDASPGGEPSTSVVAIAGPAGRVTTRSTTSTSPSKVENTAPW